MRRFLLIHKQRHRTDLCNHHKSIKIRSGLREVASQSSDYEKDKVKDTVGEGDYGLNWF